MPHSWTHDSVTSDPTRPAFALAMEASSELGLRLSAIHAACIISSLAPSQSASSRKNVAAAADCDCAGRVGSDVTLSCVQLCGTLGYSEGELLEKWARDSKILDIFEGTQQIQQLIVARRVLGLTSAELK